MKKTAFLLMALLLATVQMQAQNLSFMGVDITGTPSAFVQKLKAKGVHRWTIKAQRRRDWCPAS